MYGEIQRENDFSSAQCCRMFEKKIGDGGAKKGYSLKARKTWRAKRSGEGEGSRVPKL